ncbi:metal-dependent hydrolase family protein [Paenarthrobacter sp. JL.01a]|uniref:metal-dependent hydrolase family protein n=1 Tax=Paenarthrobacter sp. JL.01a TaxID=2979324 RepID=UPI0021C70743|nr:amidohydrolase family protein [Paenarthrobacter sp. JL.01a]UXM93484.1 amidohydrolase family protein [Paenarthrobacter sp. JL.01a]
MILRNCRLVPALVDDFSESTADVVIEEGRIIGITPTGDRPAAADDLDLDGRWLLPGLIDLHVHLYLPNGNFDTLERRSHADVIIDVIEHAQARLMYGYTTVRDCGASGFANSAVRDAVKRGVVMGPTIFSSGRIISPTTRGNSITQSVYVEADGVDAVVRACREEIAHGADFIKYMATGSIANPGGEPGMMITTEAELVALVESARLQNSYVAAHCHGKEGIIAAARAGVRTIEHASFLDDEAIKVLLDYGTAIVPTMSVAHSALARAAANEGAHGIDDEQIKSFFDACREGVKNAYEAGVPVAWGTDFGLSGLRKFGNVEFTLRKAFGFTPEELLRQATIDSAQILGIQDDVGSIAVGKLADLIVVERNPLEDIDVMVAAPQMVFAKGVLAGLGR